MGLVCHLRTSLFINLLPFFFLGGGGGDLADARECGNFQ